MSRQRVANKMLLDLVTTNAFQASGIPTAPAKLTIGSDATSPFLRQINTGPTGGSLGIESPNQYLMLGSKNGTHINGNLYWDGTNWMRYDTASPGSVVVAAAGYMQVYTCPAGANPATLTPSVSLNQNAGFFTASGWQNVSYQNGFTNISGWGTCQYIRDASGMVHFRGLLSTPATGWGHGVAAFTLPVGYRLGFEPGNTTRYHHFATISDGASIAGVTIFDDGRFCPWIGGGGVTSGAGHWFELSTIHYMSEPAG